MLNATLRHRLSVVNSRQTELLFTDLVPWRRGSSPALPGSFIFSHYLN